MFAVVLACLTGMLVWTCVEYLEVDDATRNVAFQEAGYVVKGTTPKEPDVVLLDNQREFLWFRLARARPGMSEDDLDRMRSLNQRFSPPLP